jgi:hypothetical protein
MATAQYKPNLAALAIPNQPNGVVIADANGRVTGTYTQRVADAVDLADITLEEAELGWTRDTEELFVGDGVTAGGLFLKQRLQKGNKQVSAGALIAAPGTMAAPDAAKSVLFPVSVDLTARYRIRIHATFVGGTENLSNFAVEFNSGIDRTVPQFGYTAIRIRECWYLSGALAEERMTIISTNTYKLFALVSNLTEQNANLFAEIEYLSDPTTVLGDPGPFTVTPCKRLSGSAAAASGAMYASCERLA